MKNTVEILNNHLIYNFLLIIRKFFKAWIDLKRLNKLPNQKKNIIFYAETSSDWLYFNEIISTLLKNGVKIIRITSDFGDKIINNKLCYYIGYGASRTVFFKTTKSKVLVMTLTDLETFHLKKSLYPVHYCYVFHSIVSVHRVYKEKAFDAYNTILCVGQHHINELKKQEQIYNLPKKNLIKCGYGRLDALTKEYKKFSSHNYNYNKNISVVIAPSWGDNSIVSFCLYDLIEILLRNNIEVHLRLHPMTIRHKPNLLKKLSIKYSMNKNYYFDKNINCIDSIMHSNIMISEWSGAAIEYSFMKKTPVIFIDTKPKTNNQNWDKVNLPCIEEDIRKDIGKIISFDKLNDVPLIIKELISQKHEWKHKITEIEKKTVFNIGKSGEVGAKIISKIMEEDNTL